MKRKTIPGPFLTKRELVRTMSMELDITQPLALSAINLVFSEICKALVAGGHCEFRDFGVFSVNEHKPRVGRNPTRPGDTYSIPGHRVVRFRPGRNLRNEVAGKPPAPPPRRRGRKPKDD